MEENREINAQVREALADPEAMLIDVRTPEEYASGHIPGSLNVPLENIRAVWKTGADEDTPLYLYCAFGSRAARAALQLQALGYARAVDIGGIEDWQGEKVTD